MKTSEEIRERIDQLRSVMRTAESRFDEFNGASKFPLASREYSIITYSDGLIKSLEWVLEAPSPAPEES